MKNVLFKSTASLIALLAAGSANAGEVPKTVVELFTSQGCSSCPPANEFVGTLIDDPEKLVLSYGVTYWDYLGWSDTFGDPAFTARQKIYGASLGVGYVYTPQIVLNGTEHDSRYKRVQVEAAAPLKSDDMIVDITNYGGKIYVASNAKEVSVVKYKPGWQDVNVKRGENGGRTVRIANVVSGLDVLKNFGPTDIQIKDGYAYAALVHDPATYKIVAASVLRPK